MTVIVPVPPSAATSAVTEPALNPCTVSYITLQNCSRSYSVRVYIHPVTAKAMFYSLPHDHSLYSNKGKIR